MPYLNQKRRLTLSHKPPIGSDRKLCGQLRTIVMHLWGEWLFYRLKSQFHEAVRQLRPLSEHLEKDVFPSLQRQKDDCLRLSVQMNDSGELRLAGASKRRTIVFDNISAIAGTIQSVGLEAIDLDVFLESQQIVEAILLFLYASEALEEAPREPEGPFSWKPRHIAGRMSSEEGLHKFCAQMVYKPDERRYIVNYSYCELAFTQAITRLINRNRRFQDHRALFAAAFPVALIVGLASFAPALVLVYAPTLAVYLGLALALMAGLASWFIVFTLGSLVYDREHRDLLLQNYMSEVVSLSRFPESNRNPIIKMTDTGETPYLNPAARSLLASFGWSDNEADRLLPDDVNALVKSVLSNGRDNHRSVEVDINGRSIEYIIAPFENEPAVIIAGHDVTHIRQLERMMAEMNAHLEDKVAERTAELQLTQDVTIVSLAGLAETRDPETGEHLQRTRLYIKTVAEYLYQAGLYSDELSGSVIDQLFKSAPLHDIGKVGIPDRILLKPGKLTDDEYEIMKKHAEYGGETLKRAAEQLGTGSFLHLASEIAYAHHERWDGRGYPYGLSGEAIPLCARLMALADVYDALTTQRVYKDAYSHDKARDIICEGKGTQFDPIVIDAFLACEQTFTQIAEQYRDDPELVR